jgi:hypothetical protein
VSLPPPPPRSYNWPFLGVYLISSVTNATLVVLALTTPPPPRNQYDLAHILIGGVRTFLFLSCAIVSEILRVRPISVPDAEVAGAAAPLKANGGSYGTFDHGHAGPGLRGGFMSNPPPKGGWITYVKSFKVLHPLVEANCRFSSLICGRVQIGIYKESCCSASVDPLQEVI